MVIRCTVDGEVINGEIGFYIGVDEIQIEAYDFEYVQEQFEYILCHLTIGKTITFGIQSGDNKVYLCRATVDSCIRTIGLTAPKVIYSLKILDKEE